MALNSVNTNSAALIALQSLNRTNQQLNATQNRVSSGLRVGDATQDGAAFSIAQGLRGDIRGYEAITEQLSKAKGTMAVANESAKKVSNALGDIRAVMVKLADDNVTGAQRTQYEGDYAALKADIVSYIAGASFNGTNLLNTTTSVNVISTLAGGSIAMRASSLTTDVVANLTAVTTGAQARTMLGSGGGLATAEANVGNAMSRLGADSRTLDNQSSYVALLADTTEDGVGAIVDADLAKESAKLQSLQIRQQLGTQTLGIANQAPNILLSLFKN